MKQKTLDDLLAASDGVTEVECELRKRSTCDKNLQARNERARARWFAAVDAAIEEQKASR